MRSSSPTGRSFGVFLRAAFRRRAFAPTVGLIFVFVATLAFGLARGVGRFRARFATRFVFFCSPAMGVQRNLVGEPIQDDGDLRRGHSDVPRLGLRCLVDSSLRIGTFVLSGNIFLRGP